MHTGLTPSYVTYVLKKSARVVICVTLKFSYYTWLIGVVVTLNRNTYRKGDIQSYIQRDTISKP